MRVGISRATALLGGPVLLALLGGCGSDAVGPTEPDEVEYAESLGVHLDQMTQTESGLYYQIREEGEGEDVAANGDVVTADYFAWLPNGRIVDASDYSGPIMRTLGQGMLIAGIEEGLRGMRLNETRLLVIPYYLAYGNARSGIIPPYSTLVFEVTLTDLGKAAT